VLNGEQPAGAFSRTALFAESAAIRVITVTQIDTREVSRARAVTTPTGAWEPRNGNTATGPAERF
jgi:hypothetical protein